MAVRQPGMVEHWCWRPARAMGVEKRGWCQACAGSGGSGKSIKNVAFAVLASSSANVALGNPGGVAREELGRDVTQDAFQGDGCELGVV